jgi:AcrR family transcriptional regulator
MRLTAASQGVPTIPIDVAEIQKRFGDLLVSCRGMWWDEPIARCIAFRCTACAGLRRAAVTLAAERGIETVTTEEIAERAGMTPDTFRRHYRDAEECLGAAYEEGARQLERTFRDGLQGSGGWRERLQAAVHRTLAVFARQPQLARFCLAEVPQTTIPSLRERHLESRQRIVTVLSEERRGEVGDASLVHLEVVTGAAHHSVGTQLTRERCDVDSIRTRIDNLIAHYVPARY